MEPVTVYAIFYNGQYLRKVGWRGSFEWVKTIDDARLYASQDRMKKDLSKVVNGCVSLSGSRPVKYPEVHVYTMTFTEALDQTEKFKKNRIRAEKAAITREANHYARMAKEAEDAVARAQRDLEYRQQQAAKMAEYARQKKAERK